MTSKETMKMTDGASYQPTSPVTDTMTEAEIETFVASLRAAYHAGELSKRKSKRLEKIPQWSWGPAPVDIPPAESRKSDRCVISMDLFPTSSRVPTEIGWQWVNTTIWTGTLLDDAELEQSDSDCLLSIRGSDKTINERDEVIRQLKAEARRLGYTHCHVYDEFGVISDGVLRPARLTRAVETAWARLTA